MSIGVYDLRSQASILPAVPFDLSRFRAHLRAERERLIGSRDKLAEKTGINKTTIQNAENGPDMPGIDTIARLIEGTGLSLSEFFLRMDDLPTADPSDRTAVAASRRNPSYGPSRSVRADDDLASLRRALTDAGEILFNAGVSGPRKSDAARRSRTPGRRK